MVSSSYPIAFPQYIAQFLTSSRVAEYNATVNLLNIESATPVDQSAFLVAKGELIAVIMSGQKIRMFDQQIAPAGNAALPGLAKYAAAQATELSLAQGLTGNPSQDETSLNTLKSDIMMGIQLNEMNLKDVSDILNTGYRSQAGGNMY